MRNGKLMTKRVAAVALSSMMILSPLTALASAPTTTNDGTYDNTQGDVFGGDAWDIQNGDMNQADNTGAMVTKYLDGVITEKITDKADGKHEMDSYKSAAFKKTITLKNQLNDDHIPTVPDVHFDYEFGIVKVANDKIEETHKVMDDNKIIKEDKVRVHSGIEGVITMLNPTIEFDSTDDATADNDGRNDVITKKVPFELTVAPFNADGKMYDSGIYRYALVESEAVMNDGERIDVTGSITENSLRGRVVDIVVSKVCPVPTDNTRAITGIIMREAILQKQTDGTYITEWIDEDLKTDGFTEESGSNWKGENGEIPYTLYTTYDLAIGKEITGQGLANDDLNKYFTFKFSAKINNDAKIQVYKTTSTGTQAFGLEELTGADGTNGVEKVFTLKGTERVQISGLPVGATYSLEETDNQGFTKTYYKNDLEGLNRDADARFVSMEQTAEFTAQVVDQIGSNENALADIAIHKMGVDTAGTDAGNVQNAFIVNEMRPVTITGVVMNVAPYALMVIAAAVFAVLFISKKRQEEEF